VTIHEVDGLLTVAQNLQNILFMVLIQGVPQKKDIGGIVFHHDDLRGTRIFLIQIISPCRRITGDWLSSHVRCKTRASVTGL
jgi:hypothetical protein